jgi:hypothetical protein
MGEKVFELPSCGAEGERVEEVNDDGDDAAALEAFEEALEPHRSLAQLPSGCLYEAALSNRKLLTRLLRASNLPGTQGGVGGDWGQRGRHSLRVHLYRGREVCFVGAVRLLLDACT